MVRISSVSQEQREQRRARGEEGLAPAAAAAAAADENGGRPPRATFAELSTRRPRDGSRPGLASRPVMAWFDLDPEYNWQQLHVMDV